MRAGAAYWRLGILHLQTPAPYPHPISIAHQVLLCPPPPFPLRSRVRDSRRCHQIQALLAALEGLGARALLAVLSENTCRGAALSAGCWGFQGLQTTLETMFQCHTFPGRELALQGAANSCLLSAYCAPGTVYHYVHYFIKCSEPECWAAI